MPRREIPRDAWNAFCSNFAGRHQSWLVTVEEAGPHDGRRCLAEDVPLASIVPDVRADTISIQVGAEWPIPHRVERVSGLWLEQTESGADLGLRIESANGKAIRVRFRSPVLPETVDGI